MKDDDKTPFILFVVIPLVVLFGLFVILVIAAGSERNSMNVYDLKDGESAIIIRWESCPQHVGKTICRRFVFPKYGRPLVWFL